MKSLQQIKKELHEYIDGISEEKKLMIIYENALKCFKMIPAKTKLMEIILYPTIIKKN